MNSEIYELSVTYHEGSSSGTKRELMLSRDEVRRRLVELFRRHISENSYTVRAVRLTKLVVVSGDRYSMEDEGDHGPFYEWLDVPVTWPDSAPRVEL